MDRRTTPRTDTRWWGWGDPSVETEVGERVRELLKLRGLETGPSTRGGSGSIEAVAIPEAKRIPDALLAAAGTGSVLTDHASRVRHATGQSLEDLLTLRCGVVPTAPDAVVVGSDEAQILAILEVASREGVAVIPYGGGTSVTGGLKVPEGIEGAVISLDTIGLNGAEVDPTSRTARLGAGLRGPEAEEAVNRFGLTTGHFPQSWEYATIGGFAATRSAGQASNGYGRFDEMVTGLDVITPGGVLRTPRVEHASEGPSLLELIVGSEGAFGVITEVELRLAPIPETSYEVWLLPDFEAGTGCVMTMAQKGALPAVVRLSDKTETSLNLAMSGPGGASGAALDAYLRVRGRSDGCLMIVGFEGEPEENAYEKSETRSLLRRSGGIGLGSRPGASWARSRFHGPYLREGLLDLGLVVETFETAAPWSEYIGAYDSIRAATLEALERNGMSGEVLCHLSHAYPDGASLYFTLVSTPGPQGPVESWLAVKGVVLETLLELDLPVSHHHGIGRDHAAAYARRVGQVGLDALGATKRSFDPAGIMNPGCLLPTSFHRTP
ncbi:MAG: FAD-binding oxidoreductase [Solirubrobacterales bacterium]